jgi:hypothetical protein
MTVNTTSRHDCTGDVHIFYDDDDDDDDNDDDSDGI